jgi:stage II sporulation protein P
MTKKLFTTLALMLSALAINAQNLGNIVFQKGENGFDTYRIPAIIQAEDGTYIAMESDGLARMMFVVGTDHGGSGHTGWEDNLALAARLHTALEQSTPGLMRPVNLRSASFHQQYTSGSLILELGSCAGSLDSAVRSAELFAEILTDEIIG